MSNVVQLSTFNSKKKNTPVPQSPSPKALREQAALKQENRCYFCGTRKESKELNWLNQIGFKQRRMLSAIVVVLKRNHVQWMNYG